MTMKSVIDGFVGNSSSSYSRKLHFRGNNGEYALYYALYDGWSIIAHYNTTDKLLHIRIPEQIRPTEIVKLSRTLNLLPGVHIRHTKNKCTLNRVPWDGKSTPIIGCRINRGN